MGLLLPLFIGQSARVTGFFCFYAEIIYFKEALVKQNTAYRRFFIPIRLPPGRTNVGGTRQQTIVPLALVCSWKKEVHMNLNVLNDKVGNWYDTIPGGRLTVFLVVVVCIVSLMIAAYFVERRVEKAKAGRAKRFQEQKKLQPAPYEMVVRKWQD